MFNFFGKQNKNKPNMKVKNKKSLIHETKNQGNNIIQFPGRFIFPLLLLLLLFSNEGGGVWTCAAVSFLVYPTKKKCVGVPACTWCIYACMGIVGVVDTICQWLMASLLNFNWGPDELVGGSFSSLIISFWKYQGEIASAWVLFLSLGCWLMCFSRTVWTQTSSKCSIDE